jgi:hypothetical protein
VKNKSEPLIFRNLVGLFFFKVFFNADRSFGRCQVSAEPLFFHGFIAARKIIEITISICESQAAWFCDFFSLAQDSVAQDSVAQNSIAQGFSPGI